MAWHSGHSNTYRFTTGIYDVVALREVYNGLWGQQIPRIDWLKAGYPLPEHVCSCDTFIIVVGGHV